jgi:tripartite-type tricarboxylate transporter receptor subunit TctC
MQHVVKAIFIKRGFEWLAAHGAAVHTAISGSTGIGPKFGQAFATARKILLPILLGLVSAGAHAAYPSKPVHIIVAFPAGGGLDITARLVGQKLAKYWGQPVIIENRPGASGMIGAESVARAPKDGYTLLVGSPAEIALNPALYRRMSYNPFKDLAPISLVAEFPLVVVENPNVPAKSIKDLVALSHKTPGGLPFATSGVGSMQQLVGEWLKHNTGIDFLHVPYKGTGPAISDLVGGQVPTAIMGLAPIIPHIKTGRLRGLAVTTAKRNPSVPDIPTLREMGINFESAIWFGVFAPAGTPADVIQLIQKDIHRISADPEVRAQMVKLGGEAVSNTPSQFTAFINAEHDKYSKIIKDANIKAD